MIQFADRLKSLRELQRLTQTQLARELDVTRSSVNAWEMGISLPTVSKLIELSARFRVSTDYLLGLEQTKALSLDRMTEEEQSILHSLAAYFDRQSSGD